MRSDHNKTASMAKQYVYSALTSNRNIRLLDLSPGQPGEAINCSLHIVDLDETQPYTALSYTWGELGLSQGVLCDGRELKITSNLYAALQRLRLSDRRRLVWADAICINQSDADERGKQVRLMRYIYSGAHETVVFLGEAGEEATLAIELGQKILDLTGRSPSRAKISIDNYESCHLPPSQSREWISLGMLYSVPWFRRVWIIQEFALSRNLLFRWGQMSFTFEFLIRLSHALWDLGLSSEVTKTMRDVCGYSADTAVKNLAKIGWMEFVRGCIIEQREFLPLLMLLDRSTIKESTDPRDQINALVGLSNAQDELDLLPDYALNIQQTYGRVCRWFLSQAHLGPNFLGQAHLGPNFLRQVGLPRSLSQLPSWVPDFSTVKARKSLWENRVPYKAGGLSEVKWQVTEDFQLLIANGAIVDVVNECLEDPLEATQAILQDPPNLGIALKFFAESFRMTQRSWGNENESEIVKRHTSTIFFDKDLGQEFDIDTNTYVVVTKMLASEDVDDIQIWEAEKVVAKAAILGVGWKYCLTENGRVGQIPAESLPGDRICIFPGMDTPFVIRNHKMVSNSFSLIGECFIHGLMYGEMIDQEEYRVQEVRLA